jgi:hypothetical protein
MATSPRRNPTPARSARSWAERPLIGRRADVAMVCARSTFERTPAGIRDHHAGKLDLPPPHPHGLPMHLATPSWTRSAIDAEPMGEQHRPCAATQRCGGKYFERPALFRAEVTFSPRHCDCVRHRRKSPRRLARGKSICVLRVRYAAIDCSMASAPLPLTPVSPKPPSSRRTDIQSGFGGN